VLLNAACFLLDFPEVSIEIPMGAFLIAKRIVKLEAQHGYMDELAAASMSGAPWRSIFQAECLHCGRSGTWRPMLQPPDGQAGEKSWRYDRPENHVP
jgi:hypothetical protein